MGASRDTGSFRNVADRYDDYTVVDADGGKIGTVDTTYVNEATQKEYVAVRRGLAGLIPARALASYPHGHLRGGQHQQDHPGFHPPRRSQELAFAEHQPGDDARVRGAGSRLLPLVAHRREAMHYYTQKRTS